MSPTIRFVDRVRELSRLQEAWQSGQPHLIIVTGRRRVGKSQLLARFARGRHIAYVPASQRLRADQLADTGRDIGALANRFRTGRPPALRLDDWDSMLDIAAEAASDMRLGIVLDEFPYLVAQSPELPSLIQRWWDRRAQDTRIFLVLSGSQQSVMREMLGGNGPLFGRATLQFNLQPLDYFQAAKFVPRWSPEDKVRAYAIAGGIPEYLRLLDDGRSLRDNLEHLAFRPEGALFREADYLFESEFREVSRRGSIFRAIARGSVRPNEIAQAIGLGSAADILANLRDLVDLGLIERVVPITDIRHLRQRHVMYRIADPYLRFFFSIIDPRRAQITLGPPDRVNEGLSDETLDAFVSRTFEDVARQYIWRRSVATPGFLPQEVGPWWAGDEEVDVAVVSEAALLAVGEAKWSRSLMDARDLATLERRARLIDGGARPIRMLFSRSGFNRNVPNAADIWRVRPADLFARDLDHEARGEGLRRR